MLLLIILKAPGAIITHVDMLLWLAMSHVTACAPLHTLHFHIWSVVNSCLRGSEVLSIYCSPTVHEPRFSELGFSVTLTRQMIVASRPRLVWVAIVPVTMTRSM